MNSFNIGAEIHIFSLKHKFESTVENKGQFVVQKTTTPNTGMQQLYIDPYCRGKKELKSENVLKNWIQFNPIQPQCVTFDSEVLQRIQKLRIERKRDQFMMVKDEKGGAEV